jgi:hypothetical protein
MDESDLGRQAQDQLNLVMAFFPRVDAKISVLLGIDLAMLAFLAAKAPKLELWEGRLLFAGIPLFLLGASLWHLYRASFPQLEGGRESLIYFREIASRTEGKFMEEYKKQSSTAYLNDLLSQVWRNAQILAQKFDHLKTAFLLMAWSIVPWLVTLASFVVASRAADAAARP